MKKIVSVSIGSSSRNKSVETEILGEKFLIERIGTNGDIGKAIELIKSLDGKVDAFGMGGIDIFLGAGFGKTYIIREALPIRQAARITPMADGSMIKKTIEKKAIEYLRDNRIIELEKKKVLITCAIDRFKMAEAFYESGCDVVIGDLIFGLGIPIPIKKLKNFKMLAYLIMPIISKLPFKMLYPTGDPVTKTSHTRYDRYYSNADIVAGDYHYIRKYMPEDLTGKIVITNTVTSGDVEMLKNKGASMLVTTTPVFDGRSFGTNVIEALIVSISGKKPGELTEEDCYSWFEKLNFKPRIEYLN